MEVASRNSQAGAAKKSSKLGGLAAKTMMNGREQLGTGSKIKAKPEQ